MAKTDEYWGRARPPDEERVKELRALRRRIFLGGLGWMVFTATGGYLLEHTPVLPLLNAVVVLWWLVVAVFVVKYFALFFRGRPKKKL